jgi:hypothetical protein
MSPVLDMVPGDNARAHGVLTLSAEGEAPGVTLGTDGTVTCTTMTAGTISYTDLAVTNDVTVGGDLDVTGTMHSDGALSTDSDLDVTGTMHSDGALSTDSDLDVTGNLAVGGIGNFQFLRKTADQTVTDSTDYVDDDVLTFPVVENATYLLEGMLLYSGPSAGDLVLRFIGPSGASLAWTHRGAGIGCDATVYAVETGTGILAGGKIIGCYAAATKQAAIPKGIFRTGATAGNLLLQFSQYVANVTATTLYADSYLTLRRVA